MNKKSKFITTISIIFISLSGVILLGFLLNIILVPIAANSDPNSFLYSFFNKPDYDYLVSIIYMFISLGILISSIGLLKRKPPFRISFVIFLFLACVYFLIHSINTIFNLSIFKISRMSMIGYLPDSNLLSKLFLILPNIIYIIGLSIIIVLVLKTKENDIS